MALHAFFFPRVARLIAGLTKANAEQREALDRAKRTAVRQSLRIRDLEEAIDGFSSAHSKLLDARFPEH